MPYIVIYGIQRNKVNLMQLERDIQQRVASIPELELTEKDITPFFQSDLRDLLPEEYTQNRDIVIEVCGLYNMPKRNAAVRAELAAALTSLIHSVFPDSLVECFIAPLVDPLIQGFSRIMPQSHV